MDLKKLTSELQRLSREANAGGHSIIAYLIDLAVLEAGRERKEGDAPSDESEFAAQLPRDSSLEGRNLRIVPGYTEAGRFEEANCVTVTDGERTALYVPLRIVEKTTG